MQNDSYSGNVWYTRKGSILYAIVLGWPPNDKVELADPEVEVGSTKVAMLGLPGVELSYRVERSSGRVVIQFPSMSRLWTTCGEACEWGYVLRITNYQSPRVQMVERMPN